MPSKNGKKTDWKEAVKNSTVVYRRELGAYFDATIAYVYASTFLGLSCAIYMNSFFLNGKLEMTSYFETLPFLLIPFVPAITMRLWAEDRALGTFELLLTLPLQPGQIVAGKYLAALTMFAIVLVGTFPIPLMLAWLGDPDVGLIVGGYLGSVLLGGLFLAFGLFVSGLTRDQIVAFVLAALIGAVFVLSGQEAVVEVLDGLAPSWAVGTVLYESFSVIPHFEAFTLGMVGLGHVTYFGVMSAFFLFLNLATLKKVGGEFGD